MRPNREGTNLLIVLNVVIQPRAAALAAKRKAVCFADVTLFTFYFILGGYISALAGRTLCHFCVIRSSFAPIFVFHLDT